LRRSSSVYALRATPDKSNEGGSIETFVDADTDLNNTACQKV
jgi:hypothetical protein